MYFNQPFFQPNEIRSDYSFQHHLIKVTGEATISIEPDQAIITLGAVIENANVALAQQKNDEIISTVIGELLTLGIPRHNIKTSDYRIDIQYDYENGKQKVRGYRVTHLLQITIEQIEQTGIIISTAVNSGANSVSTIQFTVSEADVYYNKALAQAVKNAYKKAATIANTLQVSLRNIPIKVAEIKQDPIRPLLYQQAFSAGSEAVPIQPGQLQISASVEAEFSYS